MENFLETWRIGTYTSEFCSYTGDWVDGKRVGHGICYYSADKLSYYDGEWLDGKRHGKGRMQYASGNFYEGDWAADQKCGDGKMSWVAQDCEYTGAWEGGKPHGYGEMIWREEAPAVSPSHPGRATNKVAQQMRNRCVVTRILSLIQLLWFNQIRSSSAAHTVFRFPCLFHCLQQVSWAVSYRETPRRGRVLLPKWQRLRGQF